MLNNDIIITRLALIKYLYKIGIEQSKQAEPVSAFSILTLHDSIEMFLKLLAEYRDIRSDRFNFLDYWESIPELTFKESMRSFNARRVNIKHKGLLPSKSDIEISRVNVTDFFEQNTLPLFGVDFKDVSLLSLVQYENVRQHLEEAQKALDENRTEDSIKDVAVAFDELVYSYENSKSSYYGGSPFFFGKNLKFYSTRSLFDHSSNVIERELKGIANFADKVKDSLEEIQVAIKIVSLGIDYKKFAKFKILTPAVERFNKDVFWHKENWDEKKRTKENCQYCIDFVLESSLKLQEFDFDINELIEDRNRI